MTECALESVQCFMEGTGSVVHDPKEFSSDSVLSHLLVSAQLQTNNRLGLLYQLVELVAIFFPVLSSFSNHENN